MVFFMQYNISAKKKLLTFAMKLNISSYRIINKKYLIILLLFLTMILKGQDNNKLAIGFGAGGLLEVEENNSSAGYGFTKLFLRTSIVRFVFKNIALVGSFLNSINGDKKQTTLGGELSYEFGASKI